MTPKEQAAMQQAVEALEEANTVIEHKQDVQKREQAITALREALAEQAEQEPVAIVNHEAGGSQKVTWLTLEGLADGAELYLHPLRTKDLTDDEIRFWIGRFPFLLNEKSEKWVIGLARAVIAADREKNK